MSATTVPAVRAALVARLTALLPGTPVFYGHPGRNVPAVFVAVADTADGVGREQRTLPLRRESSRTESYDLRLVVWCLTGDHDAQQQVTEQAWALVDQIDDDLRREPTLGGVVQWALPTSYADQDFLLNEGRAAEVLVLVNVNVNRA